MGFVAQNRIVDRQNDDRYANDRQYVCFDWNINGIFREGGSILYIEGSQVIISKKYCIPFSGDRFFADTDEMTHYAKFHQGLYCLQK